MTDIQQFVAEDPSTAEKSARKGRVQAVRDSLAVPTEQAVVASEKRKDGSIAYFDSEVEQAEAVIPSEHGA